MPCLHAPPATKVVQSSAGCSIAAATAFLVGGRLGSNGRKPASATCGVRRVAARVAGNMSRRFKVSPVGSLVIQVLLSLCEGPKAVQNRPARRFRFAVRHARHPCDFVWPKFPE